MYKRAVLLVLAIIAVENASGRDLVVDNVAGSDLQNDRGLVPGSASYGPYRTIARALLVAKRGDSIVLTKTDVPYQECISLVGHNHSGTEYFPFRIVGNGAVLDGAVPVDIYRWKQTGDDIYQYTDPRHGFAGLTRGGRRLKRFESPFGDLAMMKEDHWAFRDGYIYFRPKAGTTPVDYPLEVTTHAAGITLYNVENVIISDLTVRGYRFDGISLNDKANDIQLVGIAARHNGRSGISVCGSSNVTIGASLCELNGQTQIRTEGQSHTYLANVVLPESDTTSIDRQGGEVVKLPRP